MPQGLKPTTATADQPAPADATAPTAEQPAPNAAPRAVIPYYPSSPTTAAMRVDPHLIAAFARAAANRELPSNSIAMGPRYLRQQQAQIELQLTEPNLSAAETKRLERQKAYWGGAP